MSDAQAFLGSYRETLSSEVSSGSWPPELTQVYEPESCLKHSGTKEVYLVVDRRTGGHAVLRVSDLDATEQPDAEFSILSRLDYPGVPQTYGVYVKDGRSYLARQYFEGMPLDQVVAYGVMQSAQIYQIALQLCTILGYLHAQNPPVIHRDIKPQNIILGPDGSIGLTDFGIARTFKEGSDSDTHYMGTLPYAPPEQYGYAQSSPQTDIYALGIVLIYLATGSPDRRDLDRRITDSALRALIEKCIAFDPKDRFKDVGQVAGRINSLKTKKIRVAALIAGACVVVALLGVGVWQLVGMLGQGQGATPQAQVVEASSLIEWNDDDYSSVYTPQIGSTSWLYDYNNAGNLQSNINHGGFAVTLDSGNGFFVAGPSGIYEFDADGTVKRQVYAGTTTGSLNIYKNYLYFTDSNGTLYKLSLGVSGSDEPDELSGDELSAERVYFDNGRMYCTNMFDDLKLYQVPTDGSGAKVVSEAREIFYPNIVGGICYYSNGADGNRIYALELATGKTALLYDSPAHWLSVCNGRIYFSDDNGACLASVKLDGTDYQVVFEDPCYQINANPHGVYAINAIDKDLIVIDAFTGEHEVLVNDDVEYCVAGEWVIYRDSELSSTYWMVRQDGTENQKVEF